MTFEHWMRDLSPTIREQPLNEIAIPGSHDSGTGEMKNTAMPGPDLSSRLRRFWHCIPPSRSVIYRWSHTQECGFSDQLRSGIRYLDLRLGYDSESDDIWLVHGLLCCPLHNALKEICSFVSTHPSEVVLLDFNHFYAMDQTAHTRALSLVSELFGSWLCPKPADDSVLPSLQGCSEKDNRVIVFYQTQHSFNGPFWPAKVISAPWPNVTSKNAMLNFLEKRFREGRPLKQFYVTQGILTPSNGYIARHLCRSLLYLANRANPAVITWLTNKKAGPQGINICIVDFVSQFEYIGAVIAINSRTDEDDRERKESIQ